MVILSNNCVIRSFLVNKTKNYSKFLSIHWLHCIFVWVNNFETSEIQVVLSRFFREGNDIAHGCNRDGGGWAQYKSIKWSMKKIKSHISNLGSYWTFPVFTALQTEDEDIHGLPSPVNTNRKEL